MLQVVLALVAIGLSIYLWQTFPAFKWIIAAILGLPLLLLTAIFGYQEWQSYAERVKEEEVKKPKVIHSFQDISLDERFSDLNFRKTLIRMNSDSVQGYTPYSVNLNAKQLSTNFVEVEDATQVVKEIRHICPDVRYDYDAPAYINAIGCGDTGESIKSRYGKSKIQVLCWRDPIDTNKYEEVRIYRIPDYNVSYSLAKNKVYALEVTENSFFSKSYKDHWVECSKY